MAVRSNYLFKDILVENAYTRIESIDVKKYPFENEETGQIERICVAHFLFGVFNPSKGSMLDSFEMRTQINTDELINFYHLGYAELKNKLQFRDAVDEI